VVDTDSLVAALESGHLGGAAVDVFDEEPLPVDHPLRSTRRLLATPHIGYVTERGYRVFYGQAVENIEAFLSGSPIRVM
jgi:phosphoglycerate dehydrogenase-like enzyme